VGSSVKESRSSRTPGARIPSLVVSYDTQTTGMPAARAACTRHRVADHQGTDGGPAASRTQRTWVAGPACAARRYLPPTTTSTQAARPAARAAPGEAMLLVGDHAVPSPASCRVQRDSAAPAYGCAFFVRFLEPAVVVKEALGPSRSGSKRPMIRPARPRRASIRIGEPRPIMRRTSSRVRAGTRTRPSSVERQCDVGRGIQQRARRDRTAPAARRCPRQWRPCGYASNVMLTGQ